MGVVQYYGSQKLFFRRAFADLSHPFAPNVKCIRIYDIIFVILFSVEDLSRATKVHPSYMQQYMCRCYLLLWGVWIVDSG